MYVYVHVDKKFFSWGIGCPVQYGALCLVDLYTHCGMWVRICGIYAELW